MAAATKKLSKAQQFIKDMIRHRGIEFAQIGMMVEVDGGIGTIQGLNDSANLDVVFSNKLKSSALKSLQASMFMSMPPLSSK